MATATLRKRKQIGQDFKSLIIDSAFIRERAESNLDGWKERYSEYTKKSQLRFDLNVNHDISLEIEDAENRLKRKLTDDEYSLLEERFNIMVVKLFKPQR